MLALDRPGMLDDAYAVHEVADGSRFDIGPFAARTRLLPHWLPNLGIRLTAGDATMVYTGDAGPSPELPLLAKDADLLIAEASYVAEVPADSAEFLSSARQIGRQVAEAGVRRLLLTHLWPGTDRRAPLASRCSRGVPRRDRCCRNRFGHRAALTSSCPDVEPTTARCPPPGEDQSPASGRCPHRLRGSTSPLVGLA
ncbi:MAG: MBL fold metallo-hydrolase [Actinomycetota bacterium]|nr:MBL fold metallo-hydrolase [Actinomycetota bacterium]